MGWQHQDIVSVLEAKRKARDAVYYKEKVRVAVCSPFVLFTEMADRDAEAEERCRKAGSRRYPTVSCHAGLLDKSLCLIDRQTNTHLVSFVFLTAPFLPSPSPCAPACPH
jgi:hypothetical protein